MLKKQAWMIWGFLCLLLLELDIGRLVQYGHKKEDILYNSNQLNCAIEILLVAQIEYKIIFPTHLQYYQSELMQGRMNVSLPTNWLKFPNKI